MPENVEVGGQAPDVELLRRYAAERDDGAFAELVRRRVNLVYSVALRQCGGDAHLAADVAQRVFADLARKAAGLSARPVLSGWLYRSARFAASDVVRSERRRRVREAEAQTMNEITSEPARDAEWEQLRPVLDEVLSELGEADRDAVMLRFFEGRAFRDVGTALQLSEDAARMRVERALEKLRGTLARRGVTSTVAALGIVLAQQGAIAAPAGLATSVTGAALAGATAGGSLAAGAIGFMSTAKITAGVTTIAAIAAIGFGLAQHGQRRAAEQALAALREENKSLATRVAKVEQEQRAKPAEARAAVTSDAQQAEVAERMRLTQAAREEVPRSRPVVLPSDPPLTVVAAPPLAPRPTMDATKDTLAQINSTAGRVKLESGHVDNIRAWVKEDPEGVIRWIAALPTSPRQREHTLEAVIAVETETNPDLAFMLANSITRDLARSNRLTSVVRDWALRDPAAAAQAVAAANLSDELRARLNLFIERAKQAPR
jgi:RNA polymerase sigma factor (sigma-70 family)